MNWNEQIENDPKGPVLFILVVSWCPYSNQLHDIWPKLKTDILAIDPYINIIVHTASDNFVLNPEFAWLRPLVYGTPMILYIPNDLWQQKLLDPDRIIIHEGPKGHAAKWFSTIYEQNRGHLTKAIRFHH